MLIIIKVIMWFVLPRRSVVFWNPEAVSSLLRLHSHISVKDSTLEQSTTGLSSTITMAAASTTSCMFSPKERSLAQRMRHWRRDCSRKLRLHPLMSNFRKWILRTSWITLDYRDFYRIGQSKDCWPKLYIFFIHFFMLLSWIRSPKNNDSFI